MLEPLQPFLERFKPQSLTALGLEASYTLLEPLEPHVHWFKVVKNSIKTILEPLNLMNPLRGLGSGVQAACPRLGSWWPNEKKNAVRHIGKKRRVARDNTDTSKALGRKAR